MFSANFSTENMNCFLENAKALFDPIYFSLAYLVQIRLKRRYVQDLLHLEQVVFSAIFVTENVNFVLQSAKKFECSDWHDFSIFSTDNTQHVNIYQIYFIWSKSCLAHFSVQKTWISTSKTQKNLFAPSDISLAYLAQIRLRTSIYTRFTSFEAGHV
jgi:hypothetical protein